MSTTMTRTIRNGFDVDLLKGVIETVGVNPVAAQTRWTIDSTWVGGARADHAVNGCTIGGQKIDRFFLMSSDEPLELFGSNEFPNPQEFLLAGINACMIYGYAAVAALMGIKLRKLQIRTTGEIDLRGFLQVGENIAPGYESLQQTVTLAGSGTPEQFRQIHEIVKKTSPNYFNITHAIATDSRLVVE